MSIADADGSNVRTFGFGASGPWHPGTLENAAEAPASPSPSTSPAPPSPSVSPRPSPSPGFSRYTSTLNGISIDYPSGWQTRQATDTWTGGPLNFDSPAADVIFDPTFQEDFYLAVVSQPLDGQPASDLCRAPFVEATAGICDGPKEATGRLHARCGKAWTATAAATIGNDVTATISSPSRQPLVATSSSFTSTSGSERPTTRRRSRRCSRRSTCTRMNLDALSPSGVSAGGKRASRRDGSRQHRPPRLQPIEPCVPSRQTRRDHRSAQAGDARRLATTSPIQQRRPCAPPIIGGDGDAADPRRPELRDLADQRRRHAIAGPGAASEDCCPSRPGRGRR